MACKCCERERSRIYILQPDDRALLFRRLATLQTDIVLFDDVEELRWKGPTSAFAALGARLDAAVLHARTQIG